VRILITGATGLLGTHLVPALLSRGHSVVALSRTVDPDVFSAHPNQNRLTWEQVDLSDGFHLSHIGHVDAVYTLAQERNHYQFPENATKQFATNVLANIRIWEWSISRGVRVAIHASSGGIYKSSNNEAFSEDNQIACEQNLSFYLRSKISSELAFRSFQSFFDCGAVIRPFFIYGPGQDQTKLISRLAISIRDGIPIHLNGSQGIKINPIFVDDAAQIFLQALELKHSAVVNCAGNQVISIKDLCLLIGEILGNKPIFAPIGDSSTDCVGSTQLQIELFGQTAHTLQIGLQLALSKDFNLP
jgi:UDP-glucose 4-epimerase